MKYRPGHANIDADFLSRMSTNIANFIKGCTEEATKDDIQSNLHAIKANKKHHICWVASVSTDAEVIQLINAPSIDSHTPIPLGNITEAQEDDPVIAPMLKAKLTGGHPPTWKCSKESTMTRLFVREWSKLVVGRTKHFIGKQAGDFNLFSLQDIRN